MPQSSKLVFFGTEAFSLPSLKALVEAGFNIAAVVTKPDTARGRGRTIVQPIVKTYATSHHIAVLQPERLIDIHDQLVGLEANAGVLVSYGKILPQRTLDVFEPLGIINVHPSLLPRYRGPAPIEAVIENGDSVTGISIMKLTAGMDEGPIFSQTEYPLTGTETRPELSQVLASRGAELLVRTLPAILSGELKPKLQENDDVTYTSLISKKDGKLDPLTDDAVTLERMVRAYQGFPKPHIHVKNNDVIVTSSKVVESLQDNCLVLQCRNNSYLEILSLVAPSGKSMSGEAYLRGYGS